ncbi:MAG: hypothetical protein ACYCS0_01335 [bacterium]
MNKPLTTAQRLERKVEKAKDPLTRVIRAKSVELKMIAGRLEIADTIVFAFRNESGLKYSKAVADQVVADFLVICKEVDNFDAKYFNYIRRDEKSEYTSLKLADAEKEELTAPAEQNEQKDRKPSKGDK